MYSNFHAAFPALTLATLELDELIFILPVCVEAFIVIVDVSGIHCAYNVTVPLCTKFFTACSLVYGVPLPSAWVFHPSKICPG